MEEVPPMTHTQRDIGYVSPMMMMSAFGTGYYDSGVG